MLSKQFKSFKRIFPFFKNANTFANELASTRQQSKIKAPLKDYQKLLSVGSMGDSPKLPSPKLLNVMRSRQIARIMAYNQELNHQLVFQSHIECLYSIVMRFEPSIQGMSLLVQEIYNSLITLNSQLPQVRLQEQNRVLMAVMKPSLLKKLAYISVQIERYYNECLKMMFATFFTRALIFSNSKQIRKREEIQKLQKQQKQALSKRKQLITVEGTVITPDKLADYFAGKKKDIEQQHPSLTLSDFLQSTLYMISNQYYSDKILELIASRLERQGLADKEDLILTILKIKVIGNLQKFQKYKAIEAKKTEIFGRIYNQNVQRYFNLLQDKGKFLELINSQEEVVQTKLVLTQFLTNEHFNKAKQTYLNIFNTMFDTISNGSLLIDKARINCIFEIILVIFNYNDTRKIHQFLQKVEKTLVLYPFTIEKVQTLSNVCQRFGYKSDIIAERYLSSLVLIKERTQNLRGIMPHMHQFPKQLNLARKFLTYLQIVKKAPKDQLQLAQKAASELFDPNIWYTLSQSEVVAYSYFSIPQFNSFMYFTKIDVKCLTSRSQEKKRIQYMMIKINVHNINKNHAQILQQIHQKNKMTPYKLYHRSIWSHNHHSRMASALKLALHNYHYLSKKDSQSANSFLQQFLKKSINAPYFYNSFKQTIAFPSIFDSLLELMQHSNPKQFPIQVRDLQALKKLFSKNLQKLMKTQEIPKETDKVKYQDCLDNVIYNQITLPYNQQYYGLAGITASLQNTLLYDSISRYKDLRERLKMQIQFFFKFRKQTEVQVILSLLDYPHIADIYIKRKDKVLVILLKLADSPELWFLNQRQIEMQKNAEQYWKKKGFAVVYIRSKKEIQEFVGQKIKETFSSLYQQNV